MSYILVKEFEYFSNGINAYKEDGSFNDEGLTSGFLILGEYDEDELEFAHVYMKDCIEDILNSRDKVFSDAGIGDKIYTSDKDAFLTDAMGFQCVYFRLINTDEMLQDVIQAVEGSKETTLYTHIGLDSEIVKVCPMLTFKESMDYISGSGIDKDCFFQPVNIVARPYDIEDSSNNEVVYDVAMNMVTSDSMLNDKDINPDRYVESLECIEMDIFYSIYREIKYTGIDKVRDNK